MALASKESLNLFELFIGKVRTAPADRTPPNIAEIIENEGLDPETIILLLTSDYGELKNPCHQVIKSILDSGVDIDKLTYVQGDARATGVPFGTGVDRRTLLSAADVLLQPSDQAGTDAHWHLCFEPQALSAVESLLLARYWNFKQIYWHHTNRALGAMVSHVLRSLSASGNLDLRTYVHNTTSYTEAAALRYLDALHQEKLRSPSILRDLVTRRAGLFKRLLSVRAPWGATKPLTADEERRLRLVDLLQRLPDQNRPSVMRDFAAKLGEVFPKLTIAPGADGPLVLLDIPGRPLDAQMGQVFVARVALSGEPEQIVQSPFIVTLQSEFLNLSRTVRLFIPAAVRDSLGKGEILKAQLELEKLLEALLRPGKASKPATIR